MLQTVSYTELHLESDFHNLTQRIKIINNLNSDKKRSSELKRGLAYALKSLSTTSAWPCAFQNGDGRGDEVREDTNGRLKCNEERPPHHALPFFGFKLVFDV